LPADGRSERFVKREQRELRREVLIEPLAELGLVAMNGPNDPAPSLLIEDGRVVELDGRRPEDWDTLDHFVVRYGLDLDIAREAAALDAGVARMLVDVDVTRAGRTTARLARGSRA
jgi:propanediol dehydratase large subunit